VKQQGLPVLEKIAEGFWFGLGGTIGVACGAVLIMIAIGLTAGFSKPARQNDDDTG
jgi:ABC-type antimicrobial peptide transport system permease subunit